MSTPIRRPGGRRPARTPDQLRQDMVTAGLELLRERGLTVGLDSVKFEDAVAAANAPRASAYRAWSDEEDPAGPQERFHDALAAQLLKFQPGGGELSGLDETLGITLAAVTEVLEEMAAAGPGEEMTPDERGFWLRQIHRVGSNANQRAMDSSGLWHSYIAVAAGLMSQRLVPNELLEAWKHGEVLLVDRYKDLYVTLADQFGLKMRSCYTWEQFDTAAAALAEGLCIRVKVNPHVDGITRRTGPDGEEQDWTLFAICFEGLIRQFLEPAQGEQGGTSIEHEATD